MLNLPLLLGLLFRLEFRGDFSSRIDSSLFFSLERGLCKCQLFLGVVCNLLLLLSWMVGEGISGNSDPMIKSWPGFLLMEVWWAALDILCPFEFWGVVMIRYSLLCLEFLKVLLLEACFNSCGLCPKAETHLLLRLSFSSVVYSWGILSLNSTLISLKAEMPIFLEGFLSVWYTRLILT